MNTLCPPRRFRMLAEHFLTMYPNLNVDIDSELEQLKVRTGNTDSHMTVFLTQLLGIDIGTADLFHGRHVDMSWEKEMHRCD